MNWVNQSKAEPTKSCGAGRPQHSRLTSGQLSGESGCHVRLENLVSLIPIRFPERLAGKLWGKFGLAYLSFVMVLSLEYAL
jgi:hypothetical protein